jgi:beta-phosphoglucomutase-like phosphatase (HAD superfamily)
MSIKLVIFDMDGVLIDSFDTWYEAYRARFKEHGVEFTREQFRDDWFGVPFPKAFSALVTDDPETVGKAVRDLKRDFRSRAGGIRLFDGVADAVKKLREKGICVGVFSNTPAVMVKQILEAKGLVYDHIAAPPDVRSKPDPEGIERIRSEAGAGAGETLYIGDSETDSEAGRRAGVRTLIVGRDLRSAADVLEQI